MKCATCPQEGDLVRVRDASGREYEVCWSCWIMAWFFRKAWRVVG